jgi:hypothetical protein
VPIENSEKAKSLTPEPEIGDNKLVSEYEQFIKMLGNSESTTTTIPKTVNSPEEDEQETSVNISSPSTFYEFSLESKVSKDSSITSFKLGDIPTPTETPIKEVIVPVTTPVRGIKNTEKEKMSEQSKDSDKDITEQSELQVSYRYLLLFLITYII